MTAGAVVPGAAAVRRPRSTTRSSLALAEHVRAMRTPTTGDVRRRLATTWATRRPRAAALDRVHAGRRARSHGRTDLLDEVQRRGASRRRAATRARTGCSAGWARYGPDWPGPTSVRRRPVGAGRRDRAVADVGAGSAGAVRARRVVRRGVRCAAWVGSQRDGWTTGRRPTLVGRVSRAARARAGPATSWPSTWRCHVRRPARPGPADAARLHAAPPVHLGLRARRTRRRRRDRLAAPRAAGAGLRRRRARALGFRDFARHAPTTSRPHPRRSPPAPSRHPTSLAVDADRRAGVVSGRERSRGEPGIGGRLAEADLRRWQRRRWPRRLSPCGVLERRGVVAEPGRSGRPGRRWPAGRDGRRARPRARGVGLGGATVAEELGEPGRAQPHELARLGAGAVEHGDLEVLGRDHPVARPRCGRGRRPRAGARRRATRPGVGSSRYAGDRCRPRRPSRRSRARRRPGRRR